MDIQPALVNPYSLPAHAVDTLYAVYTEIEVSDSAEITWKLQLISLVVSCTGYMES